MEMPKRRGRPPGSKNKPKTVVEASSWAPAPPPPPPPVDLTKPLQPLDFVPEFHTLEPFGLTIHFIFQGAFSAASGHWEEDVVWPPEWPLPALGQNVSLDSGRGGRVDQVSFNHGKGRIEIRLGS